MGGRRTWTAPILFLTSLLVSPALGSLKHMRAHGHDSRSNKKRYRGSTGGSQEDAGSIDFGDGLVANADELMNNVSILPSDGVSHQLGLNASSGRDRCYMERFFCKVPSASCGKKPSCVKKLFVTGAAGSGTHYVAHYLSQISRKGVSVKHENPGPSVDVLVSWPSRCPEKRRLDFKGLGFGDPKALKPPMVDWAHRQLAGRCSYTTVVHLVRHPLKYLSSNFAFGQCLECWALVEHLSLPPIRSQTSEVREVILKNRRA